MKYAWTPLGQISEDFKGQIVSKSLSVLFWHEVGKNFWRGNPLECFAAKGNNFFHTRPDNETTKAGALLES